MYVCTYVYTYMIYVYTHVAAALGCESNSSRVSVTRCLTGMLVVLPQRHDASRSPEADEKSSGSD